ncbi:MAG: sulfatase-like hydrolase/transferase, partial [Melioribacteraceae bacterium]|nr:sulfatase-like hydrolase/transferase [Melioribacteraceae bacterium]
MNFRFVLFLALLLLISCADTKIDSELKESPNVVLIVGDDHGYPYFGFMGADYVQTPQMDKLAESGIVFSNGYVPANHCAPSLQTLMTGTLPVQYKREVERLME